MYQFINNGSITSTKGFKAAGIFCGIKKKKKDLAVIYSKAPCTAAASFTMNKVKAAPLLLSKKTIEESEKIQAIVVNSGNANACTGEQGITDAEEMQQFCASGLNINNENVLVSSTGVIGQLLPMDKLRIGIPAAISSLTSNGGFDAAEAIMTTDKKIKSFALQLKLPAGLITIGAICKGSGMIAPNMATMLAFLSTDAIIETSLLKKLFMETVNNTFNKISIDGETSTNDMAVILANGLSGISIQEDSVEEKIFSIALNAICREMAKSIVSDGEGATKLVTVNVRNAKSKIDADLIGKSIANSALVKTAITGADANWGRIMSAAGQSGADFEPAKVSISFNDFYILRPNYSLSLDEKVASQILSSKEFEINIDLGEGSEETTWWTCDLTEEYVRINSDYRS